MSVVYLDGKDAMISALLAGFMEPKSKVDGSGSGLEALIFCACSSYCFFVFARY